MLKHTMSKAASRRRADSEKGFTLVELLVVIVILGILAAVVVFAVSGINDRAEKNACQSEKRTVRTAVEAYNADTGDYPGSTGVLIPGYLDKAPKYWTVGAGGAVSGVSLPSGCS